MTQLTVVSEKLDTILPLIGDAMRREIIVIELGIRRTREVLRQFEKKHGMKSRAFYAKFSRAQLEESLDFIEWAGECETLKRLQEQRRELKETKIEHR